MDAVKPGNVYTAKVIGTYPELPDAPFDTKDLDPHWYVEHDFPEDGSHVMRWGGPKGEMVEVLKDGVFTYTKPDGTVLRQTRWDVATMTWVDTQPSVDPESVYAGV